MSKNLKKCVKMKTFTKFEDLYLLTFMSERTEEIKKEIGQATKKLILSKLFTFTLGHSLNCPGKKN